MTPCGALGFYADAPGGTMPKKPLRHLIMSIMPFALMGCPAPDPPPDAVDPVAFQAISLLGDTLMAMPSASAMFIPVTSHYQ